MQTHGDVVPRDNEAAASVTRAHAGNDACFAVLSAQGEVLEISSGLQRLLGGIPAQEQSGPSQIFGIDDWHATKARIAKTGNAAWDVWLVNEAGGRTGFRMIGYAINHQDQSRTYFLFCLPRPDFTAERDTLVMSAYVDPLTGLFNRRYLEEAAKDAIAASAALASQVGILVLDLNDFKRINDTFGHGVGDRVLSRVATAIVDAVPLDCIVSRYGGDEFVILCQDLSYPGELAQIAEAVKREVSAPITIGKDQIMPSVSVGYARYPDNGCNLTALIDFADLAMFQDKRGEEAAEGLRPAVEGHAMQQALVDAINNQEFVPYFQPVIDLVTGQMIGVEALCRWIKPDGTILTPMNFIPLAERLKLIGTIDHTILQAVCALHARYRSELPEGFRYHVNFSAASFSDPERLDRTLDCLDTFGLRPQQFLIELTETVALAPDMLEGQVIERFHAHGFGIALDDFGTGFSSMSLLKEIPVSQIKIDRSFIMDINVSARSRGIVTGLLGLCRALGIESVVEGVEDAETLDVISDLGADCAQGYLFGQPAPFADVLTRHVGQRPHLWA
ncbi:diguanylate cyclase (GGDEF) domain-containing protein [Tropicibacter naphthalenivorans]|uniref:Bacteriophytochrome cph2 n=1 Tax=Tropicibacter naphthalenivorans TaxID=441103 RepID=A0A0P1H2L5_9RHOB|nr:Bacteriophytochrome cph2 [Tropicibacter naphthalenivorans]SMC99399.1 diguanylate cyclase (GGDEF) domain-containing protein [Tropicibacter naphthalenivorans]